MMWKFANENPWAFVATCAVAAIAFQFLCSLLVRLASVLNAKGIAAAVRSKQVEDEAPSPPEPTSVARNERGRSLN